MTNDQIKKPSEANLTAFTFQNKLNFQVSPNSAAHFAGRINPLFPKTSNAPDRFRSAVKFFDKFR
jgi:hypothetical protein